MNPAPAPAETTPPALPPAIVSAQPDTRTVTLTALRNRALIGTGDLPGPEKPGVPTALFNACI